MDFAVMPREGIGPVKLGMSREQVRAVLGIAPKVFRQNIFATADTDYFESLGIMADYDREGRCEFITAVDWAHPTFDGKSVVGIPYAECKAWFERLDPALEFDGAGFASKKLSISVYAGSAEKSPSDPVEAVHVFVEGYYD